MRIGLHRINLGRLPVRFKLRCFPYRDWISDASSEAESSASVNGQIAKEISPQPRMFRSSARATLLGDFLGEWEDDDDDEDNEEELVVVEEENVEEEEEDKVEKVSKEVVVVEEVSYSEGWE